MKKILILLVVVLLPCLTLSADDFADSLLEQCALVKGNLGYRTDTDQLPDSVVAKFIRMATIHVNNVLVGNKVTDTEVTVAYQEAYAVDSLIRPISVRFISKDTLISLKSVPVANFVDMYEEPQELTGKTKYSAHPAFYDWVENTILLYPMPVIASDTIIIEGLGKIEGIMADTTFPSDIPIYFRPAVLFYATYLTAVSLQFEERICQHWLGAYTEAKTVGNEFINSKTYTIPKGQ